MRFLQNQTGLNSHGSFRGQIRDTQSAPQGLRQRVIKRANTVSLITILKRYGLRIDAQNRRIVCPFHSNGMGNSFSFCFYPETNSFFCFNCKAGNTPVDFVAKKEGIPGYQAAARILEVYSSEVLDGDLIETVNYSERLSILMEFSNFIRERIRGYRDDMKAIERVTYALDRMLEKHSLNNEALQKLIEQLKTKIGGNQ